MWSLVTANGTQPFPVAVPAHPCVLYCQAAFASVPLGEVAALLPCVAKGQGTLARLGHRICFWGCCWWCQAADGVFPMERNGDGSCQQQWIVPFEVIGPLISHARCCLFTFSTFACRGLAVNTLSLSLNKLESNFHPDGKMEHHKAEIKPSALECYQISPNTHHPFQPVL